MDIWKEFCSKILGCFLCVFLSDIQIKYIFWLLQYFQEETLHQHWRLVSEAWRTALGFGAVKCFIALKWTRFPLHFSLSVTFYRSDALSGTSSDQLWGSGKKNKLPVTSDLSCTVSGCSDREHYVEKSAVKGRPPLKCINVRFWSTKQCLSMWSGAFDTEECGACQPSLLPSLNCQ